MVVQSAHRKVYIVFLNLRTFWRNINVFYLLTYLLIANALVYNSKKIMSTGPLILSRIRPLTSQFAPLIQPLSSEALFVPAAHFLQFGLAILLNHTKHMLNIFVVILYRLYRLDMRPC